MVNVGTRKTVTKEVHMARKKETNKPSELELQVLGVLWQQGRATTREVLETLPDGKPRAYTTVLSVMQVMEKKGLLTRQSEGVAHIWKPARTRRQVMGPMMKTLVRNVFGGSASAALQQLLGDQSIDADELAQIREVLDKHASNKAGSQKK
jgi:BlaI family penicillinase repressor